MCFDEDAHPPIPVIAGGALESGLLTLSAADGNQFTAFRARASTPGGAGIVVVPDVRGLFRYYEELALRFAEAGVDAVALDPFGRTAGLGQRGADFDYMGHVKEVTYAGVSADLRATVEYLRSPEGGAPRSVFIVGFCFGGRLAFDASTLGLGLAGAIGFYGMPVGPRGDIPAPADVAGEMANPILGLFGGADAHITPDALAEFDAALTGADVEHLIVSYPDAPHSFFDRKQEEYADASADAWRQMLGFIAKHTAAA